MFFISVSFSVLVAWFHFEEEEEEVEGGGSTSYQVAIVLARFTCRAFKLFYDCIYFYFYSLSSCGSMLEFLRKK